MTTKAELLRRIRENCVECMGGVASEVPLCTSPKCKFFEFRTGHDPRPNQSKSEAVRKQWQDGCFEGQGPRSTTDQPTDTGPTTLVPLIPDSNAVRVR